MPRSQLLCAPTPAKISTHVRKIDCKKVMKEKAMHSHGLHRGSNGVCERGGTSPRGARNCTAEGKMEGVRRANPPPKREQYNLQSMHLCVVGQDSTYGVDRASDVLSPRASLTQTQPPRTNPQKSKIFLLLRQNIFFRLYELVSEQKSFLL